MTVKPDILRASLIALAVSAMPAMAQDAGLAQRPGLREAIPLRDGWRFQLGDQGEGPLAPGFDDGNWSAISLPHNWNRMGGTAERRTDYQNYHGVGWYRRHFPTPSKLAGRKAWLQFDGASIITDVWLNGKKLGRHAGAFAGFRFDATAALKLQGDNMLAVRVDNSSPRAPGSPTAEIPPMNGDWPMYGGLYRQVSLILTAPVHVAMRDMGGPGIYARTIDVVNGTARIAVNSRLENDGGKPADMRLHAAILDAQGRVVARSQHRVRMAAGEPASREQTLRVAKAHLWNGVDDPYLYRVRVELRDVEGRAIDSVEQPLGIRSFAIDPDKGFSLNGRHVELRGVSRHQDRPVKGWAIDAGDIDEDMALIREIGANTVRLAHYQHDQEAYRQTDVAGMVTWAEIPLVDRSAPWASTATTPGFAANAEQQLRELIRQNYNHPSIIVWSIANEVNLEAAKGRGTSNAGPLLERLQRVVHEEDPDRPATLADCCGSVPSEARAGLDTVAGITDVIGYNRYHGWYSGDVGLLGPDLDRLHRLYPGQPISISEYGAGGALSQHSDDPRGGPIAAFGRPHPEEFQAYILEESWKQISARPYVWASWAWNMFDFSNELRMEGDLTDTNDKGLVSFDRKTKKDAFYFFKANWSQTPFIHLTGRRYVDRPYPLVDVKAYSNQPTARLSLNGRDLGNVPCHGGICLWPAVALASGANQLTASAGAAANDAVTWQFSGRPGLYRIRAGTLVGKTAADGTAWGSDVYSTGGTGHFRDKPSTTRGGEPGPVRPVAGTHDQAAYESWREGRFSYAVPVPNGRYRVRAHFFEPDERIMPSKRVFSMSVEGKAAGAQIDVRKEAGAGMRALVRTSETTVADGIMDVQFEPLMGEAILSGLEVLPLD
ncbi:glycoside hydrolase family 2 TIM barrel-domain containing protein [Sphingobium sp. H39-3-25]|uniref:glycoside hydrolase family 2 TIM barrel-domain containing protein n=1 Tax=Sphingobium arseniciresistens TaxID=3030834 RepID=UPI0023B9DF19|nr:glycoside hydrolase family 2 TIM barrel-domain containing protein [Sphingobium arseniciresistens]